MEYQIILPEIIGDEWQNIGIDFEPQSITGNIKGENKAYTTIYIFGQNYSCQIMIDIYNYIYN